jgi:hypothetical protein
VNLEQFHDLKVWHQRHRREQPLEKHVWDLVLTFWLAGWVGAPAAFLVHAGWALMLCGALVFLPSATLPCGGCCIAAACCAATGSAPCTEPGREPAAAVGRTNPVAALVLGGVERHVGPAKQRLERVFEGGDGDPRRDRHLETGVDAVPVDPGDRVAHPLGRGVGGLGRVGDRHQHQELLAAEPAEPVGACGSPPRRRRRSGAAPRRRSGGRARR